MILSLLFATLHSTSPAHASPGWNLFCSLEANVPGVQSVEIRFDGHSDKLTMIENIHGIEKPFEISKQEYNSHKIRLQTEDDNATAILSYNGDWWVTYRSPGFNISGPADCDYK